MLYQVILNVYLIYLRLILCITVVVKYNKTKVANITVPKRSRFGYLHKYYSTQGLKTSF